MNRFASMQPFFAEDDGGGGGATTFELNGQQMTAEQVVESYKKLQGEYTKVTQSNSELKKQTDEVKPWLEYTKYLQEVEEKTGRPVRKEVGAMMDSFVQSLTEGKAPTQTQMNQLGKEIDNAQKAGDDETAKRLQELEAIAFEAQFEKAMDFFSKQAESEGIDFKDDDFRTFAAKYLEEEFDIGDDDEFTIKQLKAAYTAYEAKMLKEARKKDIPPLGTSGGSSAPDKSTKEQKVGGLKGAMAKAAAYLGN